MPLIDLLPWGPREQCMPTPGSYKVKFLNLILMFLHHNSPPPLRTWIREIVKYKMCRVGHQVADQVGKSRLIVQDHLLSEFFLAGEGQSSVGRGQFFVIFRPSTNWMRPNLTGEGNLLYPKPTNLDVILTPKYPYRTIQNKCVQGETKMSA